MPDYITTAEAARILTERGFTSRDGGPVREQAMRKWLWRGLVEGAVPPNNQRGLWRIPRASMETFTPPNLGRPAKYQEPNHAV